MLRHRHLLLKLDRQIGGTIYRPFIAINEAYHLEGLESHIGGGGVQYICLVGSVTRWLNYFKVFGHPQQRKLAQ